MMKTEIDPFMLESFASNRFVITIGSYWPLLLIDRQIDDHIVVDLLLTMWTPVYEYGRTSSRYIER